MTREDYIKALKSALLSLPASDIADICGDFEEHFSIGLSQGKTEHEISAELGDPSVVAATYFDEDLANIGHTMSESAFHAAATAATSGTAANTNGTTAAASAATAAGISGAALSAGQPAGTASVAAASVAPKEKDLTGARLFVIFLNILVTWWVAITIVSTLVSFWGVTISLVIGGIGAFIAMVGQAGDWITLLALCGVGAILLGIATGILNFFLCKWTVIGTRSYIKWNKKVYNEGF